MEYQRLSEDEPDNDILAESAASGLPISKRLQRSILIRLYTSHFLSYWNSRTFEFGAVLFLAGIFPGTLLYASIYALGRALTGTLLSPKVGSYVDRTNRLKAIRSSIIWQRFPVAASCGLFLVLFAAPQSHLTFWLCFPTTVLLACFEKLAAIGNTIAVERDWIVVVADAVTLPRQSLNATLRRIDLCCKLIAPLILAIVEAFSMTLAIWTVFGMTTTSMLVEYLAIAQVYSSIPELAHKHYTPQSSSDDPRATASIPIEPHESRRKIVGSQLSNVLRPWKHYFKSPAFLASFSLSLLYLTVLSTSVHWQTYMLSLQFSGLSVAIFRLAAVTSELSATVLAPLLMKRIGPIRSGLWSINWQLAWLALAIAIFLSLPNGTKMAGAGLTAGIVMSRLGLWGLDLSVQLIVQESVSEESRGIFSACEMGLQNLFELVSFVMTIVWADPMMFRVPVIVSFGSVAISAGCFAGFVRKERGHLIHLNHCLGGGKGNYRTVGRKESEMSGGLVREEEDDEVG
jgi:iron-regulated transporter 1